MAVQQFVGFNPPLSLIKFHEGCRLVAYKDTRGIWTIGYGHTGPEVIEGLVWTQEQADAALYAEVALALARAVADLGQDAWDALDPVRQAVLVDMAYELGGRGLAGFRGMLGAIRASDWAGASVDGRDSAWDFEVPSRADMDMNAILSGSWPSTVPLLAA